MTGIVGLRAAEWRTWTKILSSASSMLHGIKLSRFICWIDNTLSLAVSSNSLCDMLVIATSDKNGNSSALFSLQRSTVAQLPGRRPLLVTFRRTPSPHFSCVPPFKLSSKYRSQTRSTRQHFWRDLRYRERQLIGQLIGGVVLKCLTHSWNKHINNSCTIDNLCSTSGD